MGTGVSPSYISGSSGTFTLSAGATLGITDPDGITFNTNGSLAGNIRVTGNRNFDAGANYIYNGSVNQNTNTGLPSTVNSLVFNNTGGIVTFNSARTITEGFSITTGSTANLAGFTHDTGSLTLGGVGQASGSYGGTGSGADNVLPAYFTDGPGIVNNNPSPGTWLGGTTDWNTASNWVGGVPTSESNASITSYPANQPLISGTTTAFCNTLTINPGASLTIDPTGSGTITTVINNGTMNFNSSSSGIFSMIMGSYSGSGTAKVQLFLTGGGSPNYNWHYVAEPFTGGLSKTFFTDINTNLMAYDNSRVTTSDFQGWLWHNGIAANGIAASNGFSTLAYETGYNFYNGSDVTVTLSSTGSLGTSLPTATLQYAGTGSDVVNGYNLLGNSLTCSLDWDDVTFSGSVGQTVYFTSGNKWISYLKGAGSTNTATNLIPPLQGFFVKADATGATVSFPADAKVNSTQARYKSSDDEQATSSDEIIYPKVKLELNSTIVSDETIIWFNDKATTGFDEKYDGYKLFSSEAAFGQLYSVLGGMNYVINGIPLPAYSYSVPLGVKIVQAGTYSLLKKDFVQPDGFDIYLIDKASNYTVNLKNTDKYSFVSDAGTFTDRFVIKIISMTTGIADPELTNKNFNIYYSNGNINILPPNDINNGSKGVVKIYDLTGRTISELNNIEWNEGTLVQVPFTGKQGIYIVEARSGELGQTSKFFVH